MIFRKGGLFQIVWGCFWYSFPLEGGGNVPKSLKLYASGLLWAWGYLVHFISPDFFAGSHLAGLGFSEDSYLLSALCGYALAVLLCERRGRRAWMPLSWVGCAGMLVGGGALGCQAFLLPSVGWLAGLGGVAAGAGMAACTTVWGVVLTQIDPEDVERTALSWCGTFAAVVLVVGFASTASRLLRPAILGLLMLLPVGAQIGLSGLLRAALPDAGTGCREGVSHCAQLRLRLESLGPLVNLLCAFFSLSFIWSVVSSLQNGTFFTIMGFFALAAMVLWGVLWLALRYTRRFGLSTLYRWALPLTLGGIACASLGFGPFMSAAFIMVLVVDLGFEIVAKLFFVYVAKRWRGHEAAAFALGMAVINAAGLFGSLLWSGLRPVAAQIGFPTLMLFALIPFVVAVALVLGNSRDSVVRAVDESSSSAVVASEGVGEEGIDPVAQLGAALERAYRLTPREAEVVALLAQGRSRSYVREALFISKGTVDTHAYHAYAKMGIKTKDELMRLVDGLQDA
ncbi:LuxR C-terminal-related transcriptional regulator [Adlercreutzia sp. R7]|uniref:LuxR C-terminal-related transcriptional regulator n=1 Tax=Adlercreutzia wanghongyangiae TaxID=3111451 RepID=A0ABU6II59_9ACTN|nr:LuxR C-terminal-related transcriptional regulator [Adlercreutzia sp. R7]